MKITNNQFDQKKYTKFGSKVNPQCFMTLYAIPENVTPALLVMLETFRRSAVHCTIHIATVVQIY